MTFAAELIDPSPGTPWPIVAALVLATIITPAASAIVVALINRPVRRGIAQVAADTRITRDQTTNSHTTNLRDDLDRIGLDVGDLHTAVDRVGLDVRGMGAEVEGLRTEVEGLRTDERQTRKDLGRTDERVGYLAGRLDHHLDHTEN